MITSTRPVRHVHTRRAEGARHRELTHDRRSIDLRPRVRMSTLSISVPVLPLSGWGGGHRTVSRDQRGDGRCRMAGLGRLYAQPPRAYGHDRTARSRHGADDPACRGGSTPSRKLGLYDGELDPEAVAIAALIVKRKTGIVRSGHVPRPISGGSSRADRGKAEGLADEAAGYRCAASNCRSHGSAEAQPRTRGRRAR